MEQKLNLIKTIINILSLVFIWLIWYLILPTISVKYLSGLFFIATIAFILALNITMWFSDEDRIIWQPPAIVGGLTVLILIIGSIAGCRLFTVDTMYRQLGEVETI